MYAAYRNQEYRQQEVMSASPIHLVVMAYDLAIQSCEQKNFERAVRAVTVLRDALDFDYSEVAANLFGLYQWCLDCLRKEDFVSAKKTLVELREAWVAVEKRHAPRAAPVVAMGALVGRA